MGPRVRTYPFLGVLLVVAILSPSVLRAATSPVFIRVHTANGTGVSYQAEDLCGDGGSTDAWTHTYSSTLQPGAFSSIPSSLELDLELRSASNDSEVPNDSWLHGTDSLVTIENERGSVVLELTSGSCDNPTLVFDGSTASGSGTWSAKSDANSGAYRQATGSGQFNITAAVGSEDSNPLSLDLAGSIAVLDPALTVDVIRARWDGAPEGGYHHATVTYLITNSGVGDAFNVRLTEATAGTTGITPDDPLPESIGDIPAGGSSLMEVRYRFDNKRVCIVKGEGCAFDAGLSVEMPDALDKPATFTTTERVRIPTTG